MSDAEVAKSLPPRTRDEDLDAIGDAIGESFYLSSQGMSEWPTLDECTQAGRRAAREIDHRITDWQYRTQDEWKRALQNVLVKIEAARGAETPHVHLAAECPHDAEGPSIWWLCGHAPTFTERA